MTSVVTARPRSKIPELEWQTQTPGPLHEFDEFDEYGTELHRDARVWKVYVKEADKHDTELVNQWNHSLDVILVYAALFSAILTAFLIESTKQLQPDPAEQSAQTLAAISQTLSAISNGTQLPGSVPPPSSNPAEFTLSRAAVWVNMLWYLSLSFSLVASFLALLAKDWSHSFMSGRTGQPHLQMRCRQQKWDMIEKWKMPELLTIIPSLIHVSLLFFVVGLCIYLLDIHYAVAIPTILGTGTAIGFYIWSSITAIYTDYFPYPTIISRACRTEIARRAGRKIHVIAYWFACHPMTQKPRRLAVFVCVRVLKLSLYIPLMLSNYFNLLDNPLDKWRDTYVAHTPPPQQPMEAAPSKDAWHSVRYSATVVARWFHDLQIYLDSIEESLESQLPYVYWKDEWQERNLKAEAPAGDNGNEEDDVISLALSWLITNCKDPQSVDVALQSIAGATSRTPHQPLLDCHARSEILHRLASNNLHKGSDARTDMIISLYTRALVWLGGAAGSPSGTGQHGSGEELEGLICDVHLESEKRVAAAIASERFDPTPVNFDALQIGNTAASNALKLLGGDLQQTKVEVDRLLGSIIKLLESHVDKSEPLHEAALLSLVNATALLSPFAPNFPIVTSLCQLCVKAIGPQLNNPTPQTALLVNLAIACVHISRQLTNTGPRANPNSHILLQEVVRELVECYAGGRTVLSMRSMFELEMLATHPGAVLSATVDLCIQEALLDQAAAGVRALYDFCSAKTQGEAGVQNPVDVIQEVLGTFRRPPDLVLAEPSSTIIPFLVLGPIHYLWWLRPGSLDPEWSQLASKSRFPTHSRVLVRLVEKSDFIFCLERMIHQCHSSERFIALGQLWLLLTAYLDHPSDGADGREGLGVQLRRHHQTALKSEHAQRERIGDQLVLMWESGKTPQAPLGRWPARLMECVYQSRDFTPPEDLADQLREHDVPKHLRGLSSFTSWRPERIKTETHDTLQPSYVPHMAVHYNNISDAEMSVVPELLVPGIGAPSVSYETDHTRAGGWAFGGDGRGVAPRGSGSRGIASSVVDGGEVFRNEGSLTALVGQRLERIQSGNSRWEFGPESAPQDGENHVSIHMHVLEDGST